MNKVVAIFGLVLLGNVSIAQIGVSGGFNLLKGFFKFFHNIIS